MSEWQPPDIEERYMYEEGEVKELIKQAKVEAKESAIFALDLAYTKILGEIELSPAESRNLDEIFNQVKQGWRIIAFKPDFP